MALPDKFNLYFQVSAAAHKMLTDQLNAHPTGRPVRERAGIDQVGNFLLSRLSGANGVSSNEFNKHLNQHTAETTVPSCSSQKEPSSSRRKSPPVPTMMKLEQSPDSVPCTNSDVDLISAKHMKQDSKIRNESSHSPVETNFKSFYEISTHENRNRAPISNIIKSGIETNNFEQRIKLDPRNYILTMSTENGEFKAVKDELDVNLNQVDPRGRFLIGAHNGTTIQLQYNNHNAQHTNSSSDEESLSGSDFSIRKVNLQQNLRRMGQTELRGVRATQRTYKGRSTSCSPPTTALTHITSAAKEVTSPYISPRCSPTISPPTSPPRQDFGKVTDYQEI